MPIIELINLKESDINEEFVEWHNKEHSKNYTASRRKFTKNNLLEEYFDGIEQRDLYQYLIHHKQDKKNIGIIKIGPIDINHKKSDLVAFIGNEQYLRKGLGSEAIKLGNQLAFNKFNIRKVHGPIIRSNIGAIKVYLKADWVIEAILKGHYLVDGKTEDAVLVACYNPKYFDTNICTNSNYKLEDILNEKENN